MLALNNSSSLFAVASALVSNVSGFTKDLIYTKKEGAEITQDTLLTKGTSFSYAERDRLHLRGLVPPAVHNIELETKRAMEQYNGLKSDMDRHVFLRDLQDTNETLFYKVLIENIGKMAPMIYTPVVGAACKAHSHIWRRPRGMFFSKEDKGHFKEMIFNYPVDEVDVIVVTDGGRILGLGDLGVNGHGIPIGKLSLYVGCAGLNPAKTLPVTLDMGTNNKQYLEDPFYVGLKSPRTKGAEFYELVDEFIEAVKCRWPNCLIQFEDFTPDLAPIVLEKYRHKHPSFNDDIQGTGAVVVSGVMNSLRAKGGNFEDIKHEKIVILGAGGAGTGIAENLTFAMQQFGATDAESKKNIYLVDKDGLLAADTLDNCSEEQKVYVQHRTDVPSGMKLLELIKTVKPSVLIGVTGVPKLFNKQVIEAMCEGCERPTIFPLSNPTANSECTAKETFEFSNGKAIFASGSPFDPVEFNGKVYQTSQCNNMFIFPGMGLGAIVSKAKEITQKMFFVSSKTLAEQVTQEELDMGMVYPRVQNIRKVTEAVSTAVAKSAIEEKLSRNDKLNLENVKDTVKNAIWHPTYKQIVHADASKAKKE